jgi:SRSO17 transposase
VVRDFVGGLLAPLPVKNCWTIAEHAGDDSPGGMQDLIGRASWDDRLVRADLRDFVTARLGHPDGILVVDETGDLKKGTHTVGVLIAWSIYRRRHQDQAKASHYARQALTEP